MSIERESIWPPLPSTARSVPVHLSYDPKSDRLAYASGKSVFIRPVDPAAISKSIQFVQHNAPTTVAKFAPSGFYVASGDETGNVKIWDCVGEDLIVKGEYQVISGRINDLQWDSESKRIVAVGNGKERYGHCFTWDSGNTVGEISGHSAQINAVSLKPNRPFRAVTVSDDSGMVFLQGPPFKFAQSVRGHHSNYIKDVAYSADGEHVVSVGSDRKIVVYEGKTGEYVKTIENDHTGGIYGVSWDLDNAKQFVTCSADGSVKLFNVESGDLLETWSLPNTVENQLLGVVATKDYFVALSLNGNLNYFKAGSPAPVEVVKGHQKSITSLKSIGESVYSGSYDGRIVHWNASDASPKDVEPSASVLPHSNLIVSITGSSSDIVTTAWDDTVKRIDGASVAFGGSASLDSQPRAASSHGDYTAVATSQDKILVFSNADLAVTKEIAGMFKNAELTSAVALSGKYLVVGTSKNEVLVFDAATWELSFELPPLQSKPTVASISPDDSYVAVGDVMGKIVLYDLEKKSVKTSRWSFHTARINSISWNADNDRVVSGSLDTNIIVYSVSKPSRNVKFLNAHKDGVSAVDWLDSTKIVSGGNDGAIKTFKTS